MTEEEKAKFHVIVNNWRKRNPERARLIQQRANKKYLGKNLVGNKPKDGGMANDL